MKLQLLAAVSVALATPAASEEFGPIVSEAGVFDHNSLDLRVLSALTTIFDSTYHRNTPAAECDKQIRALEESAATKNVASGGSAKLSFDQQLEIDSAKETCMDQVLADSVTLYNQMAKTGRFPTISLVGLPFVIANEQIREGTSGDSYVYLDLCGLPEMISLKDGDENRGIIFNYPAADINFGNYKFNTNHIGAACSGELGAESNWKPNTNATLSRQIGFSMSILDVTKGAKFREYVNTGRLSASVDCHVSKLKIAGGTWPLCVVNRIHIVDGDGKVFLTVEGFDRSWTGSAPFADAIK